LMERLCVLYPGGRVDVQDLPGRYRGVDPESDWAATPAERECLVTRAPPFPASGQTSLKHYLETLEASLIRDALGEAGGVVARAARSLRLNRTTLAEKMRRYEIASVGPETGEAAPGVEAA
jgi:sigma-54 specific flagellar transcriptional regulator A